MGQIVRRDPAAAGVGPFDGPGLGRRILPFAAVAILAEASVTLPPGPQSWGYTELSMAGLALVALALAVNLLWKLPEWTSVLVPLVWVGSVLSLSLAAGGSASGVGVVMLTPLLWACLYHHRWESLLVLATIVTAEVVTSLNAVPINDAGLMRRVIFWALLGILISVATHALRDRLSRTLEEREESLRRTEGLVEAAKQLSHSLNSGEIVATATKLAAQLVSPPGATRRRAQYSRVSDAMVSVVAQYDQQGEVVATSFPLAEHPNLAEVLRTGAAINRPLDTDRAGHPVHGMSATSRDGVHVPVYCRGEIDGVLSVPTAGHAVSSQLFECCQAIAHLTELALDNARAHELLEAQATTDSLTGLVNRRGFDHMVEQRPGRLNFCVLVLDVDGLKEINDSLGHAEGDEMLTHVAGVLGSTVRSGDVLARLGGDEFAAILFNANEEDGAKTAMRMLGALYASPFHGESCSVSIGVASGGHDSQGRDVYRTADAAMYQAKREGGRRYSLASAPPKSPPPRSDKAAALAHAS